MLQTPVSAWAYGHLQGYVRDDDGLPINGAKIETDWSSTTSYSNGFYILSLPAATYTVTASAAGYESQRVTGITISDGQYTNQDFNLSPANLKLESVYPTLGELGKDLDVKLTGTGFDTDTRVSISPDIGNKKAIISSLDTPGNARDIVISGTTAYVADGNSGLVIIDISDPANPANIGSIDTPHEAWGVALSGNRAFVADGESGLQIIDVSDPSSPSIIGFVDTPHFAHAVTLSGNTAYIADRESGLQIVDVSNPSQPTIIGFYDTPGEALDVVVSDTLAYVADSYGGLQIINVSNPSAPTLEGSLNLGSYSSGIFLSGTTVYVATASQGLRIFNVSDPTSPTLIGQVETPGWALGVVVSGTTAYVADGEGGLQIIDAGNASSPKIIGTVNTPGDGADLALAGTKAYIADGYEGLTVTDISNPSMILIGSVQTSTWAQGIAISGNYAYVTEAGARAPGVTTVDISDPFAPIIVDEKNLYYCYGIEVAGHYAYVANSTNGLTILDIASPSAPAVAGTVDTPGNARGVAVSGTIAAISDGYDLQIIDVSDPANPFIITSVDPDPADLSSVYAVAMSGNTIGIVGNNTTGLRLIDISDPYNPIVSSKVSTGYAQAIALSGDYAYVGGQDGSGLQQQLHVVDINPSHPEYLTIVGSVDTTYSVFDVTLSASRAYLANYDQGVQIVDISDPQNPTTIGTMNTLSSAMGVAVSGNAAFVADYLSGMVILPIPVEVTPVTVNSNTEISVTLPGANVAGPYTLRVFNDTRSHEIHSAVSFTGSLQTLNSKAIIVAGGGPDAPGEIWEETKLSANKAYDVLVQQGYDHDSIYYLSMETGNQYVDKPSLNNFVADAISNWAANATELLIFFVDHGGPDHFIVYADGSYTQNLTVDELDDMLDTLQETMSGPVTFIYDACQSGTFVSKLKPSPGKTRVIITSASNEPAYFLNQGIESFSFQFWDKILFNEGRLRQAFTSAGKIMEGYQTALLDSDGDGIANQSSDMDLAGNFIIRRGSPLYLTHQPVIGNVSVDNQTLSGGTSATIQAEGVENADSVRAQIIPPDINPDTSGTPITDLPSVELTDPETDGIYEGTYNGFTTEGTYIIIVKAITTEEIYSYITGTVITQNIYSIPVYVSVTQTIGIENIEADSYEEDDAPGQASVITINDLDVQPHNFHDIGDMDWVKFYGLSGQTYKIKASNVSIIGDVILEVYDSDGISSLTNPVNDQGAGEDEYIDWSCPQDGIYYVKVSNFSSNFGENCKYDFEIYKPIGPLAGFVSGMVSDGFSAQPLKDVRIKTDSNQTALSLASGEYLMVHPSGTCTVTAEQNGYRSKSISGVQVIEGGITALNIALLPNDTDGDGIPDTVENSVACLDPLDADSDDDGIPDGGEDTDLDGSIDPQETDPCDIDSDDDGIQDGTEAGLTYDDIGADTNTNVFQPDLDPSTTTDPLDNDSDNDGLLDGEEDANHNGRVDPGETDPNRSAGIGLPWWILLSGQ